MMLDGEAGGLQGIGCLGLLGLKAVGQAVLARPGTAWEKQRMLGQESWRPSWYI